MTIIQLNRYTLIQNYLEFWNNNIWRGEVISLPILHGIEWPTGKYIVLFHEIFTNPKVIFKLPKKQFYNNNKHILRWSRE